MATEKTLYGYQKDGVMKLVSSPKFLLADDMGLGKTVQIIVSIESLFKANAIKRALIVCPVSLQTNWKKEMSIWAPNRDCMIYRGDYRFGLLESDISVLIASYETITNDWKIKSNKGTKFFETDFDLIVVDEAQKLKNADSLRTRILSKSLIPRRWAITGTPLENRPEEIGSIFKFLEPNEFIEKKSLSNYSKLLEMRNDIMLRRSKKDVLTDLPEKVEMEILLEMTPVQRERYYYEINLIKNRLKEANSLEKRMAILLKGIQVLRRLSVVSDGVNQESGKADYLIHEIEKIKSIGEKAVIFSSFANLTLPFFEDLLEKYGCVKYVGAMSAEEREEENTKFMKDPNKCVMLASLMAAGVGLNWVNANHVYHTDIWWNPQIISQANDRVHRIGQEKGVFVKKLISEGSIEQNILGILDSKKDLFELVVEGVEEISHSRNISEKDLFAIMGID